jgi:hypothetical protein
MCLDFLDSHAKSYTTKKGKHLVGYKLFDTYNHHLIFRYIFGRVQTNKWIKDKKTEKIKIPRYGVTYPTGFHIYLTNPVILHSATARIVYYKKPVEYGRQDGIPVVVARELFVPSHHKKRPKGCKEV